MILASLSQSPLATGFAGFVLGALLVGLIRRSRRTGVAALLLVLIGASSVNAHEGHDHAPEPAVSSNGDQRAQRQPDGTLFVPKPIQRIFGLRTIETQPGTFARTLELPGRVIPDPNASGYVQTAIGGVLSPPPGGFPRLGAQVTQGDILAYVTPPIAAIDVSDMRQKQGELDQQIAIVQRAYPGHALLEIRGSPDQIAGHMFHLAQRGDVHRLGDTIAWVSPTTGEILVDRSRITRNAGETFMHWLFPLHSGTAFGAVGMVAMCATGVVPTLLVASGLWVWLRKRRGERIARNRRLARLAAADGG
jgi:hypothetical protein